ncbi:MFS transporter [Breznakiella homolactica]|uniref:MFS transporter n=1 Tax=Breznakiella homolactica TaxID=2798577 RepID=A0A7T7XN33_9SPIR|nr:MFS transporter [Breznakiella homolactica]QQO09384.1 MFS transporter [Breznakiella homolactica]
MSPRERGCCFAATAAFTYCFVSLYSISPLLQDISAELGLTAVQAGGYTSWYFAGYILSQIPGGMLADRYRPKWILLGAVLCNGLMAALMAAVPGYGFGLGTRFFSGLASGSVMGSCSKTITAVFPGEKRSGALGILLASPPLGILIANLLGGILRPLIGWRWVLLGISGLSVLTAAAVSFFLNSRDVPRKELETNRGPGIAGLRMFLTDYRQVITGIAGALFMFSVVGFATWINPYSAAMGLSGNTGRRIILAYSLCAVLGASVSGFLFTALKISHCRALMIIFPLLSGLSVLFAVQTNSFLITMVAAVYGFTSYLPSTHFTSLAIIRAGDTYGATAASVQNLFLQSGSLIMPVVTGLVIDTSGNMSLIWLMFSFLYAAAAVLVRAAEKFSFGR